MDENEKSLFELVGGRPVLDKVHKIFYAKVYDEPSLAPFFEGVDRDVIASQQTDFTASQMGGDIMFSGKTPLSCHQHMFITQAHFDLRNNLLREALQEFGISDELAERWLKLGEVFANKIVKSDMSQCKTRYKTEKIITAPPPH
jgi:truncated hemoglobin YjbI